MRQEKCSPDEEGWCRTHNEPPMLCSVGLRDALRAHANAVLGRAWNAGAAVEATGKDPQRVQDETFAAFRALREEG